MKIFFYIFFCFISCAFTDTKIQAIPAMSFSSDTGFGGGLAGSIFTTEEGIKPYKTSIDMQGFLTTKNIHSHYLKLDILNAFGLDLRLTSKLGFYSSLSENYCGWGSGVSCGADGVERKNSNNQYYLYPIMSIFGGIYSRWLIYSGQAKWEIMASYRGNYIYNGTFKERGPYKNSLYSKDFSNKKIDGYISTLEFGLMIDDRDRESSPTNGYWLESSIRGGGSFTGSAFDFFGFNAIARFYTPLDEERRLVFASQTIVDGIIGDLPYFLMAKVGGSKSIDSYAAFGGQNIGRGIRDQMFVGRLKLIQQFELRHTFLNFSFWSQDFALTWAFLADIGLTTSNYKRLSQLKNVLMGFGSGLRIHWNENFIIRADGAVSPYEGFSPKIYVVIGNVF